MEKLDLKKQFKHLYLPSAKQVAEVEVPEFKFLMIDGEGDPNTSKEFAEAVEALFTVSYTAKFMLKKSPKGVDYGVMPLEALWWSDDPAAFAAGNRKKWKWTAMIMQPDCLPEKMLATAMVEAGKKKALPGLAKLRVESFAEGKCAQVMHIGPFSAEGPTIQRVHEFIEAQGKLRGRHHEIYLSDIRKMAPEKWKTVVRQPMR